MFKRFLECLTSRTCKKDASTDNYNKQFTGTRGVREDDNFYLNRRKEGYVDGKHFTEYVETVRELKRAGRLDEAEALLLKLVDATEAESRAGVGGVAPWYYKQLAIIYRKQTNPDKEVAILQRYEGQEKAPGATPPLLAQRLKKAEELLKKSNQQSQTRDALRVRD